MSDRPGAKPGQFSARGAGGEAPAILPPRFTLKQLAYFVAAGEACSITIAASRLNISGPSISSAIAQLEAEIGIQLFIRHHAQGLSLTPDGAQFLHAARLLLLQSEDLHEAARGMNAAISGPLRIGSFRTFSPLIIPELCRNFLEDYPSVELSVVESNEEQLISQIRRGEVSLALSYKIHMPDELHFRPLAKLPTYILLPQGHALAERRYMRLGELADEPFILLDMPLTREYFLAMFEREGLTPLIVAASEFQETVRSYVACGFGYSLATARPKNKMASNGLPLAYVQLDGDFPQMELGITTRRDLKRNRTIEAFEQHCQRFMTTETLPGMASWS